MKNVFLSLMLMICGLLSSVAFAHEGHTHHPHAHLAEYGVVVVLVFIGAWVCWNFFPRD